MEHKPVIFKDDELEIAIVTYNRSLFIKEWLKICYLEACKRNISIVIYDSSTDDETEKLIKEFNKSVSIQVKYIRLESDTVLGYKPMIPILNSEKKYIWISGDSRCHNFSEMDELVFPFIKDEIDYILFLATKRGVSKKYTSNNLGEFLHECFLSSTCLGFSIYKTSLFSEIKDNIELKNRYDTLFKNNYGFGWLGYFYNIFAKGNYTAVTCRINVINIMYKKKKQVWAKRFYECWLDNLCQVIDNIPENYVNKDTVPREVWKEMKFCNDRYLYNGRTSGDLNEISFNRYITSGLLDRVTNKKRIMCFYAKAPMFLIEIKYNIYRVYDFMRRGSLFLKRKILKED